MVEKKKLKKGFEQKTHELKTKSKKVKELTKKEILLNIPSFLNALRIFLTFVVAYMIITDIYVIKIVVVFAIAAITDWFDGRIARKYHLVNSFGAKADMVADRFLWVGTSLVLVVVWGMKGYLTNFYAIMLAMMLMREIIAAPVAIVTFFHGNIFPPARYIAKLTTFIQGFALPSWMLSVFYPKWIYFTLPLTIILLITGTISGFSYIRDVRRLNN